MNRLKQILPTNLCWINHIVEILYHMRYVVAFILLIGVTVAGLHGDSMSAYDYYIQPGLGNDNLYPISGQARVIRSDEWVVTTPAKLASSFGEEPFSKYNEIQRAAKTLNILNGVEINIYSVIRNPFLLGWLFLDRTRAFSLNWYAPIFLAFLISMEFFYIIGNRNKMLAFMGACLTICSSFYLWWGFPTVIWSLQGCIVCAYYFLNTDKFFYRILLALGFTFSFLNFATPLYPAWQVPFGFVALCLGIWMLYENFEQIRKLKRQDWILFFLMLAGIASLIGFYFYDTAEYIKAISTTVYPGKRSDSGGYFLNKLFYYFQAIDYAYKDLGLYAVGATASEKSAFISFFPLPTLAGIVMVCRNRKQHFFLKILLMLQLPMLFYITTGLPDFLAKITLFSLSTRIRMVDVVGFIQILLLCYIVGRWEEQTKVDRIFLTVASFASVMTALFICKLDFPDYMISKKFMLLFAVLLTLAGIGLFASSKKSVTYIAVLICILISFRTGFFVRPVMKGLDAIYEKPVAKKITELVSQNPEQKWITADMEFVCSGFLVACGAPTLNSTNVYPNMEFWHALDPDGSEEEIYNRYAHIAVILTDEDTSMELAAADNIQLYLSYQDLAKIRVNYILTRTELENKAGCQFEKLYDEADCKIYQVNYQ